MVTDDYKALLPNHLSVRSGPSLCSNRMSNREMWGDEERRREEDVPHRFTFKTSVWALKKLYGSQVDASYAACGIPPICKSFLTSCNWYSTGRRKKKGRGWYLQVSGDGWFEMILPSVLIKYELMVDSLIRDLSPIPTPYSSAQAPNNTYTLTLTLIHHSLPLSRAGIWDETEGRCNRD